MRLDQFYQAEMMTICGTLSIVSQVPDSTDANPDVVGVVSYVGPLEGYITQKNQEARVASMCFRNSVPDPKS